LPLDQYAANKAFVVHDPALRAAVYSYFESKARFYFEKPIGSARRRK